MTTEFLLRFAPSARRVSFVADAWHATGASESRNRFDPKPSWLRASEGRGYYEEVVTPFLSKGFVKQVKATGKAPRGYVRLGLAALSLFSRPSRMKLSARTQPDENESRQTRGYFSLALFALCAALIFSFSSCSSRPVEEIVTTDASRSSALTPGAQAVAKEPNLPARDADIEAAGDRIAEAITYLNSKRREAALRALNQSETALNRALRAHARDERISTSLRATLKDLDVAERAIQRNSSDATKQLAAINRNLDGLDLQRTQPAEDETGQAQAGESQ